MLRFLETLLLWLGAAAFFALLAGCLVVACCLAGRRDSRPGRPKREPPASADPWRVDLFPWE
jgi:hypothetical protein